MPSKELAGAFCRSQNMRHLLGYNHGGLELYGHLCCLVCSPGQASPQTRGVGGTMALAHSITNLNIS